MVELFCERIDWWLRFWFIGMSIVFFVLSVRLIFVVVFFSEIRSFWMDIICLVLSVRMFKFVRCL